MTPIARLTAAVVWCETLLSWAAIAAVMIALSSDPALAFRAGAALATVLAIGVEAKAHFYHLTLTLETNEIWRVLGEDERPPPALARALIVVSMRRELHAKAGYSAAIGGLLLLPAMVARVLAGV